jgi:hypothetical protein
VSEGAIISLHYIFLSCAATPHHQKQRYSTLQRFSEPLNRTHKSYSIEKTLTKTNNIVRTPGDGVGNGLCSEVEKPCSSTWRDLFLRSFNKKFKFSIKLLLLPRLSGAFKRFNDAFTKKVITHNKGPPVNDVRISHSNNMWHSSRGGRDQQSVT